MKYIWKGPLDKLKYGGIRNTQSSTTEPTFSEHPENLEFQQLTNIPGALRSWETQFPEHSENLEETENLEFQQSTKYLEHPEETEYEASHTYEIQHM